MRFHTNYNGIKRPAGMCGEEYNIWRKEEEKRLISRFVDGSPLEPENI